MRLSETTEKRPAENILPLINVVFLMLIFFLVAATLKPFAELDVKPPEIETGLPRENTSDTVLVDAQGKISFEGAIVTAQELTQRLKIRLEMGYMPRLKVLADKNLSGRELIDVLAAATAAGARHISLVTARRAAQ